MKLIDRYIDELLESTPETPLWNQEMIRQGKKPHWNYIDGCMMTAFLTLYKKKGDIKFLNFVKEYIDYFIAEDGSILTYEREAWNLDNINEGRALFALYDHSGNEKYRKALDVLYDQLINQPRTAGGNFWHKAIYPDQIWLDGLYMAQPFYLEYEKRFNGKRNYRDILSQYKNVYETLRDRETGLYFHACDTSRKMFWCDRKTGLSRHFWLRAIGWFYMSLVDVLELLDKEDYEFQKEISEMFKELTDSLLKYQDESGMWFQIADLGSRKPNYLETSGSSIIAFALLKAVRLNILPRSYYSHGERAFKGICREYLYEKEGKMNLGGTCLVAGLGGKERRDGSFEYYMSEPVVENEAKGIAPFILAYLNL
ncbi:glycoside hydrolase family 88/105 protein [Spirochaeta isovalerica]|uniref:Unsaturated rhamnogalacturonyl hydrolase n=1 Tax=Spirochaeta isovalerica TaxID=150 RepID=A0A841RDB5_9SPIO|nr:glycoside hydrolase family 88 protein [Spirochaeta isovalerica]MBB6481227.1 unsaturated rhamnogalacturonyl hydrolase [Spirochaeta isovalerica]